jgi:uncharacterized protein (TIGR03435 family)
MHRCFSMSILLSQLAFAQSPAKVPEFEVAEIKVSKSLNPEQGKGSITGGRVDLPNVTLKSMIMSSYGVQDNGIIGAPSWMDSDRFDVVAKADPSTPQTIILAMFQPLLTDRFKLVLHREDRPMPVYALVVGKAGPKLQPASGGQQTCRWNGLEGGRIQRECHNMTMEELAVQLPRWGPARLDLPVVDLTEIHGAFDFKLEMSVPGEARNPSDVQGTNIFDAVGQLGLKLERGRHPVSVIVIDHAERIR